MPMFRALIMIMIVSVDRLGSVALRSEILCMPFFHLFDIFDISKCSHCFLRFSSTKRPLMCPTFLGQKQFVTAFNDPKPAGYAPRQNWNYALKLKIDTPKINWGIEDGIKSLSWKFELNWTRNRFFKIKRSFWKKYLNAPYKAYYWWICLQFPKNDRLVEVSIFFLWLFQLVIAAPHHPKGYLERGAVLCVLNCWPEAR